MPHVIEDARARVAEQGFEDRCEFAAGNMFESVPAGADAYFMKHILHDWDDAACGKILAAIHAAMPPDGRLLVSEKPILPGAAGYYGKITDLVMLVHNQGGRERTEAEYRDLFAQSGFKLIPDRAYRRRSQLARGREGLTAWRGAPLLGTDEVIPQAS